MIRHRLAGFALALALVAPASAQATSGWTTYLRFVTCTDILALRDTVWLATGEAGLVRYRRSTGAFDAITREPGGLASNAITALAYDRSGRLWAGTPGKGVSRLSADGTTWDLVNAFDGLPSDTVSVLEAQGDTLWIGTPRGLALWDGTQIAGAVPDLGTPSPFRSNVITGVAVVHDSVFIATGDGMYLSLLSQRLATWAPIDSGLRSTSIVSLASDGHEVFALAASATHRWDMTSHTWGVAGGQGSARSLADDMGVILCGTATGLWQWNINRWEALAGSPTTIGNEGGEVAFATAPDGISFATRLGLLYTEDAPSWSSLLPPGPAGNNIQNIVVDSGRLWMNTFSDGVGRFDGAQWRNWPPVGSPASQDTTFINPSFAFTLVRDALGRKWIANWDIAVERIDDSTNPPIFTHVAISPGSADPESRHTLGWAGISDPLGNIYIGGDTTDRGTREPIGIDVYSPDGVRLQNWNTNNAFLRDNQVRALAISSQNGQNTVWAGFPGSGVSWAQLDPAFAAPPHFMPVTNATSFDVFGIVAHGDSIWVLTTGGLQRIGAAGKNLINTVYSIPAAPAPRGAVHPLEVSADGTVWVASVNGVRRFLPGGGFEDYTATNSPLANDEVRAIAADPATGVVWFGTAAGLNRFDPGFRPPPQPVLATLRLNLYPNPVRLTGIGLELRLGGNASAYDGEILSLDGHIVRRFSAGANGRVVWDGRDTGGHIVRPGVYFVHARGGGREATGRVAVLR